MRNVIDQLEEDDDLCPKLQVIECLVDDAVIANWEIIYLCP